MKKRALLSSLFLIVFLSFNTDVQAVKPANNTLTTIKAPTQKEEPEVSKKKMSFKEKVALWILKKKLKKAKRRKGKDGRKWDGMALSSFALGILGVTLLLVGGFTVNYIFIAGMIIAAILAMIFGAIGLRRLKINPAKKGKALAITGLVLGGLLVGIGMIVSILWLFESLFTF